MTFGLALLAGNDGSQPFGQAVGRALQAGVMSRRKENAAKGKAGVDARKEDRDERKVVASELNADTSERGQTLREIDSKFDQRMKLNKSIGLQSSDTPSGTDMSSVINSVQSRFGEGALLVDDNGHPEDATTAKFVEFVAVKINDARELAAQTNQPFNQDNVRDITNDIFDENKKITDPWFGEGDELLDLEKFEKGRNTPSAPREPRAPTPFAPAAPTKITRKAGETPLQYLERLEAFALTQG